MNLRMADLHQQSERRPIDCRDIKNRAAPKCLFLGLLPADIRNIIYVFVFTNSPSADLYADFSHDKLSRLAASVFSLSVTCRQIYAEARDLPLWLNTFHMYVPVFRDISVIQRTTTLPPMALPLPPPKRRRRQLESSPMYELTTAKLALRLKSQEFITKALRAPEIDETVLRLEGFLKGPIMRRLRKIKIHLGDHTVEPIFLGRFETAWDAVSSALETLRTCPVVEMALSFSLRVSKGLVVEYDFPVRNSFEKMLVDMDQCVPDGELSLPELATINTVRTRICGTFFTRESARSFSRG